MKAHRHVLTTHQKFPSNPQLSTITTEIPLPKKFHSHKFHPPPPQSYHPITPIAPESTNRPTLINE
jgi:hypothetical protein